VSMNPMPHGMVEQSPPVASPSAGGAPQVIVVQSRGGHTVWWVLTVVLAVIATALVMQRDASLLTQSALAQMAGGAQVGARGIYAFSGQLSGKSYGLYMVDVDAGTVWCYEMERGPNGGPRMKLVAARSWLYDRHLEEFNIVEPIPSAVKLLVEQQRARDVQPAGFGVAVPPTAALPDGDAEK